MDALNGNESGGCALKTKAATAAAEVRYVPTDGISAYYGTLLYYAVLAYPGRPEWPQREEFVRAMKAQRLKLYMAQGGNRAGVLPAYRSFKNEKIQGKIGMGFRRIACRLSAGSMAYCLCLADARVPFETPTLDGALGLVVKAPSTVNKAAEKLQSDKSMRNGTPFFDPEGARTNIEHRIWANSLQVLHLALSLYQHIGTVMNCMSMDLDKALVYLTFNVRWLRPALVHAERLRSLLRNKVPTFAPEEATCLLPTQDLKNAYLLPLEDSQQQQ